MITSLPNLLTLSRIAAIPVIIALLFLDGHTARWIALAVYITAGVTDFFDGYIARSQQAVSALGRFLDPIADKLMVISVLFMLVAKSGITGWVILPALVIVCREVLVSGLREYLAELRVSVPVSQLAKWKTAIQMTAIGILIVGEAAAWLLPAQLIGEIGLWVAAALTLLTGYVYMRVGLRHMTQG